MWTRLVVFTVAALMGSASLMGLIAPGPAAEGPPPTTDSRGTVINNYYPGTDRDYRNSYPGGAASGSSYYGSPPLQQAPYGAPPAQQQPQYFYQPYSTPSAPPYYERPKFNDNREWIRQQYFNNRYAPTSPYQMTQPNAPPNQSFQAPKRPSLSDRIQQEKQMRRNDSQLQRDYIREESLRTY